MELFWRFWPFLTPLDLTHLPGALSSRLATEAPGKVQAEKAPSQAQSLESPTPRNIPGTCPHLGGTKTLLPNHRSFSSHWWFRANSSFRTQTSQEVNGEVHGVILLEQLSPGAVQWKQKTLPGPLWNFWTGSYVMSIAIPVDRTKGIRSHPGSLGLLFFASGISSFQIGNGLKEKKKNTVLFLMSHRFIWKNQSIAFLK